MGVETVFRGNADAIMIDANHLYVREKFLIPWAEYSMHRERIEGYRYVEVTPLSVYRHRVGYYTSLFGSLHRNEGHRPIVSNGHSLELPQNIIEFLRLKPDSAIVLIANINCFALWEKGEHEKFFSRMTPADVIALAKEIAAVEMTDTKIA